MIGWPLCDTCGGFMSGDPEIEAMSAVAAALKDLGLAEQARVIEWASKRFDVPLATQPHRRATAGSGAASQSPESGDRPKYTDFAELFSAAGPTTNVERALVAAYWAQVVGNKGSFRSQELNVDLKNLGHYDGHIGDALDALIAVKPQQVLQLKKAGNTKQARRTFKLSVAGIAAVAAMLGDAAANGTAT